MKIKVNYKTLISINCMKKKIFLLCNILVLLISFRASGQMAELPFSEKIQTATDIFEGKVINKTCFWNDQHTLIFTANTIEIYKVFKGNIRSSEVEIITEGGQIDNEIQDVESNLNLKEGDIGVFIAEISKVFTPKSKENKIPVYRTYGGPQGFIKYDLLEKTASDPFRKYKNIQDDVYKAIKEQTQQSFRIIKPFNIDKMNETDTKKESFWSGLFKKKHKKK